MELVATVCNCAPPEERPFWFEKAAHTVLLEVCAHTCALGSSKWLSQPKAAKHAAVRYTAPLFDRGGYLLRGKVSRRSRPFISA